MDIIQIGESVQLDTIAATLVKNGVRYSLSHVQFRMIQYMVHHPNQLITKDALKEYVWGSQYVEDNHIQLTISRLRKILEDNPRYPQYLLTIYGAGYLFRVAKLG